MNIDFRSAFFIKSAQRLSQCPIDLGAEVAFAGRSNAGKSSAINALTENNKLARTSKTPGRTQLLNFFALSEQQRLVDLPGYGYAKVPLKIKEQWQKDLTHYLQERQSLRGLVQLMDIRHPLKEYDQMMLAWANESELPVHVLLTKADKLKKGPAKSTLLEVEKKIRLAGINNFTIQLFSAPKQEGLPALKKQLKQWLLVDEDVAEEDQGTTEE